MDASLAPAEPIGGEAGAQPQPRHPDHSALESTQVVDSMPEELVNATGEGDVAQEADRHATLHSHSESMVTVRLSSASTAEEPVKNAEPEQDLQSTITSAERGSKISVQNPFSAGASEHPEDNAMESQHLQEDAASATEELSRRHEASEQTTPSEASESEETHFVQDPVETGPFSPTISIESQNDGDALQNAAPTSLESELYKVAARARSTSTRSSESSGSEPVDWAKLDSHEEQEERHHGTDEVSPFDLLI